MSELLPPHEHEVTVEEVIMACADVLDEGDRVFIKDCEFDEALSYIYGKLVNNGVADPEADLVRRGILRAEEEL